MSHQDFKGFNLKFKHLIIKTSGNVLKEFPTPKPPDYILLIFTSSLPLIPVGIKFCISLIVKLGIWLKTGHGSLGGTRI